MKGPRMCAAFGGWECASGEEALLLDRGREVFIVDDSASTNMQEAL